MSTEIEAIALGAPVSLPYRSGRPLPGETVPTLQNDQALGVERGAVLLTGLRLVGAASAALAPILDAVGRQGLNLGGVRFLLLSAHDGTGRLLYDRRLAGVQVQMPGAMRLGDEEEPARRVRVVFVTPAVLKREHRPTFDPADLAECFFDHCLARSVHMYNGLTGRSKLPWMETPAVRARVAGHRLFHYILPRRSYRQDRWLGFDGVVGWLDLEGDLSAGMPHARAAEVLHWGQKATFGLGKVRVLVLE